MKSKINKKASSARIIISPHRWQIIGLSLLSVTQSVLQVVLAVVIKYVIDAALTQGNLMLWGSVLVGNLLAIIVFYTAELWYAGKCADTFTAELRKQLLWSATHSKDAKLQSYHSGELLSRGMEDVNTISAGVMHALPLLAGQITRLVGSFAAVLLIQPVVAIILLVMATLMTLVATALRPLSKRCQRQVRQTEETLMATMQEDFQQMELIQSLQAQQQVKIRFDLRLKEDLKAKLRRRCWTAGSNGAVASASYIGTGFVLLWGAAELVKKTITYGDLTSIMELLSLFRGPVLGISGQWNRLTAVEVACERLMDMLVQDDEQPDAQNAIGAVEAVVFEDVTFCYPGDEIPVVEHFNAIFPLSGWTCLTGISGKGKSTLFKLMLGLYKPQQGRVYLQTAEGNIPCSEQTRHLFAYVPQDYAMLSGTVLENLQLVAPEVSEAQCRAALELADAGFIWETATGLQTRLGENNTGLSKGQLQRIAIARAILMDRPIFLLDECTSALDALTEDAVLHNLRKLNKNAILVTHRPQAVEGLDNVTFVPMDQ